jgi:hypothetical protein
MGFNSLLCGLGLVSFVGSYYLEQVTKGNDLNNFIKIIMGALRKDGGVFDVDVATKLMSFGVDGVNVFQGMHNGVTCQIQHKFPPHLESIHCMA